MWALTGKCDLHFIWQGSLIIRIKTVIETEAHRVANGRCSLAANTKCWPLNEGDLYWGQREFTIAFLESSHTPVPLPIGIVSDIYLENSLGFLCLFCFSELFFKSIHYPHWVKSPSVTCIATTYTGVVDSAEISSMKSVSTALSKQTEISHKMGQLQIQCGILHLSPLSVWAVLGD